MLKLLRVAFVVTIAAAAADISSTSSAPEAKSPKVGNKGTPFPTDFWGVSDWIIGLVTGGYGPIVTRTRENDCFTNWYRWGISTIEFSNFFAVPFDIKNWK